MFGGTPNCFFFATKRVCGEASMMAKINPRPSCSGGLSDGRGRSQVGFARRS
jgi:hypothetical protein